MGWMSDWFGKPVVQCLGRSGLMDLYQNEAYDWIYKTYSLIELQVVSTYEENPIRDMG